MAQAPSPSPIHFVWEDHSSEEVCPAVQRGRALRDLCQQAVILPTLANARADKTKLFQQRWPDGLPNTRFVPLPFTAGGGLGPEVSAFLDAALAALGPDTPKKIKLRNEFYRACSIALVKAGADMAKQCRPVRR